MQINQNFNDYIYLPSIPRFQIFHISNMLFLQIFHSLNILFLQYSVFPTSISPLLKSSPPIPPLYTTPNSLTKFKPGIILIHFNLYVIFSL